MLEHLQMQHLGPIRQAQLTPAVGMTAITGETGAGKSMLLSAIKLICGDGSDAARVSAGASQAWAQGIFAVGEHDEAYRTAQSAGVEPEDGELFLTRTVPASGRSKAMVCGRQVPRSVLASLGGALVTIHGQADQLRLASPVRQRAFVDGFAGVDALAQRYAASYGVLVQADERVRKVASQQASDRQQADYLRDALARIERVDPQPDEDEQLKVRRDRIEHAAGIAQAVSEALAALDPSQVPGEVDAVGAVSLLEHAAHALRAVRVDEVFGALADRLQASATDVADVVFALSRQLDDDEGVEDLDAINARLHELRELTDRWGPTLRDVVAWRERSALALEDLDASPERVEQLRRERDDAYAQALADARELFHARDEAARRLSQAVGVELEALSMPGASLRIEVSEREPQDGEVPLDAYGCDTVSFWFTPFPGAGLLPMGKSASGGELSRLMLALELVAARDGAGADGDVPAMTFIFDEVDAGVGGQAAQRLGRRLARLAQTAQVMVVTHLPQVASWADAQFVVDKSLGEGDVVETTVREVRGEERVCEIARMLSGKVSATSKQHAQELLDASTLS